MLAGRHDPTSRRFVAPISKAAGHLFLGVCDSYVLKEHVCISVNGSPALLHSHPDLEFVGLLALVAVKRDPRTIIEGLERAHSELRSHSLPEFIVLSLEP